MIDLETLSSEMRDHPITLDVVDWDVTGGEYQIKAMVNMPDPKKDMFVVTDTNIEDSLFRISGATFQRYRLMKEPQGPNVYRRDEGVKKTGILLGGSAE